ncbi:MAG: hypothetical protein NDJ18_06950 [candidate division Zixibacteria bacterium]|nr:hypothetical protein [candidate division Zixibacteria bacterium]
MHDLSDLRSYADIRKYVPSPVFGQAMGFISWHNRLTMTPMLEPWEALVVSLAYQQKPLDGMVFTAVKAFLEETRQETVVNLEQANGRARQLIARIS